MNMTLDLSYPTTNRFGGMGSQRGILVLDVVRAPTVCKTGLGAETDETERVGQSWCPRKWPGSHILGVS